MAGMGPGRNNAPLALLESIALCSYRKRWAFWSLAIATTGLIVGPPVAAMHSGGALPGGYWPMFVVAAPISLWVWALLLVGVWFHPRLGTLGRENPGFASLPRPLRRALHAWALVSLLTFLLAPGLVLFVPR